MSLPEDRDALVIEHLWLVTSIARKICSLLDCNEFLEDLKQEGTVALIRAVDRYDPNEGAKVATYAYSWVRGSMYNFINNNARQGLKISRSIRIQTRKVVFIHDELMKSLGRIPKVEEIAEASSLTTEDVETSLNLLAMSLVDFEEVCNFEDVCDSHQRVVQSPELSRSPEEKVLLKKDIYEALDQLNPDRKNAVILRYIKGLSNKEAAEAMGKTEGSLKVLVHRGLKDLNRILGHPMSTTGENSCSDSDNPNHGGDADGGSQ